jgi:hypothetical protein
MSATLAKKARSFVTVSNLVAGLASVLSVTSIALSVLGLLTQSFKAQ